MFELTRQFRFDAAHTLKREIEAQGSRRIHGHSYRAEVTLRGEPDPRTGMIMDSGLLAVELERVRSLLEHHMLDDIAELGPGTMENLCAFIWRKLGELPGLHSVAVIRDSTAERAVYFGEGAG